MARKHTGSNNTTPGCNPDEIIAALVEFVSDVDQAGGVCITAKGSFAPIADQNWIDLGETYVKACKALRRQPVLAESSQV